MSSRLSFIIPAHNEAALIGRTLEHIHRSAAELEVSYEVIVTCDACTDETQAIAERLSTRTIVAEHRQIARSRNSGGFEAQGEILFFIDADTFINAETVREAIGAIERGAAGGGALALFDGKIPFWGRALLAMSWVLFPALRATGGAFLFCRRDVFHAVDGFNVEMFAGEEVDFAWRIKGHSGRKSFEVLRKKVVTSGRKLRTHSGGEFVRALVTLVFTGPRAVRNREKLDMWYGPRRTDPHADRQ